jgi:O-antigen/teichoic acid export membrane protein
LSVIRNTAYNFIGSIIPLAVSFVSVPLYLKIIGQERYGILSIAWVLLGYFGLFDLGLGRAVTFRIAATSDTSHEARSNILWAGLSVNLALGAAGAAVLWLVADYFFAHLLNVDERLRSEILMSVPLLAASLPVATTTGVLTGAMQGRERFLEVNLVSTLSTVLFQLLPLMLAWFVGPHLVLLLSAALSVRIASAIVLGYQCRLEFSHSSPSQIQWTDIRSLMNYGGWVTVTSSVGALIVVVDRFVIGAILDAKSVATYSVPYQLAKQIAVLPAALTNALFPRLTSLSPTRQRVLYEEATATLTVVVSLAVLGAILLLEPFLQIWIGSNFAREAAPIGRVLLIGFWANALALVSFTQIQASGRPDLVARVHLFEFAPYLVALYFAATNYGLLGCAFVASARFIADYVLLAWLGGQKSNGWLSFAINFLLLILAEFLSRSWGIMEWNWWFYGAALSAGMFGVNWMTLPNDLKHRLIVQMRTSLGR